MSPTLILIYRRGLQTTDIDDAFTGIPETSPLSPATAAGGPNMSSDAAARRTALDQSAPFDSSMALTIIVLLTALFVLGFFSVYLRRFAPDTSPPPLPSRKCGGGLDSSAVDSLPLVAYGGDAKHPMIENCPICLSEFNQRETVKLIPRCGHVFHPSCIDTWLAAHVTCPLCRSAELFERVEEVRLDVAPHSIEARAPEIGVRSTVGIDPAGIRRACSCSNLPNRAALRRSTSF